MMKQRSFWVVAAVVVLVVAIVAVYYWPRPSIRGVANDTAVARVVYLRNLDPERSGSKEMRVEVPPFQTTLVALWPGKHSVREFRLQDGRELSDVEFAFTIQADGPNTVLRIAR